jgi:hypothetical protein
MLIGGWKKTDKAPYRAPVPQRSLVLRREAVSLREYGSFRNEFDYGSR